MALKAAVIGGVAIACVAIGLAIAWPYMFPLPKIRSLDQLLNQLSTDTTAELNDPTTRFRMPILPVNAIGTLVDPKTRGGYVNNHGCLITVNTDLKPAANLFPSSYVTSVDVAASLPNLPAIASVASSLRLSDSDLTDIKFSDIEVAMVGTDDIRDIASTPQCSKTLDGRSLWIVRGYVQGKRTIKRERRWFDFLSAKHGGDQANGNLQEAGDVIIADENPVPFMEIISQINVGKNGISVTRPEAALAIENPLPRQASSAAAGVGHVYFQRDISDTTGNDRKLIAELLSDGIPTEKIVQKMTPDRLPKSASVRYFNDVDKPAADRIFTALKAVYPDATERRFQLAAPTGQMEVWFPPVG